MPELEEFVKLYVLAEVQTVFHHDTPAIGICTEVCVGEKKYGPFTKEDAEIKKAKRIKKWLSRLPFVKDPIYVKELYETKTGLSCGCSFEINYGFVEKYIPKSKISVSDGKIVIQDGGDCNEI